MKLLVPWYLECGQVYATPPTLVEFPRLMDGVGKQGGGGKEGEIDAEIIESDWSHDSF